MNSNTYTTNGTTSNPSAPLNHVLVNPWPSPYNPWPQWPQPNYGCRGCCHCGHHPDARWYWNHPYPVTVVY